MAIHDAFERHGIALGSAAMLAPTAALPGKLSALRPSGRSALSAAVVSDLRHRLGAAPKAKMTVRQSVIAGKPVMQATHLREVPLGEVDSRLKGVVAIAPEPVLVGSVNKTAAILGGLPEPTASTDEVTAFVQTLLESNRIAFESKEVRQGIKSPKSGDERKRLPTHAIHAKGGKKVLERVRFACGG
jgi:hypothetical protein